MLSSYANKILSRNFAPIVVFSLSFAAVLSFSHPTDLLRLAVITGFLQSLMIIAIRQIAVNNCNVKRVFFKALYMLFVPRPSNSIGGLAIGIGSFIALLLGTISASGMALFMQLFTLIMGFMAASSLVSVLADWLWDSQYPIAVSYKIDNEYIEIFLAAMVATAFLGITYSHLPAFQQHFMPHAMVMLPLMLGLGSLFITYLVVFVVETSRLKPFANRHLISFLSMLLLLILARVLTLYLLPETFAKNGQFYSAVQLKYILFGAIFGGFLASRLAFLYHYSAHHFVDFLLLHRLPVFATVALRWVLNTLLAYSPIVIAASTIVLGYIYGDLYGAAIAMLGIVSNAGASRLVVGNRLTIDKLYHLTDGAKRKLRLVLPSVNELIARFLARNGAGD